MRKWPYLFATLALLATTLSLWRIVASYHEISQTMDEPLYLATGMGLLDHHGKYTYLSNQPPDAGFASAIFPFLDGARSHDKDGTEDEGLAILHGQDTYWRTLTLERLGILPFFITGVFLLWTWCKKMFGDAVAFLTVLCYTLIPPVLSHAGIANSDIPLTTGIIASCCSLWWWTQRPDLKRSIVMGIVLGLSACTKLTFFLFFPVASVVIIGYEYFTNKLFLKNIRPISKTFRLAALSLLVSSLTIWAIYGFSVGTIPSDREILGGGGTLRNAPPGTGAVVPAPEFFGAISSIIEYNSEPTVSYMFGKAYTGGSLLFFSSYACAEDADRASYRCIVRRISCFISVG